MKPDRTGEHPTGAIFGPERKMLDSIPYSVLIPAAVLMALAPFVPKPHLIEKLQMLFQGELRRPIDIFDLFLHAAPVLLLALKWITSR